LTALSDKQEGGKAGSFVCRSLGGAERDATTLAVAERGTKNPSWLPAFLFNPPRVPAAAPASEHRIDRVNAATLGRCCVTLPAKNQRT
jgi:hypothetical protein